MTHVGTRMGTAMGTVAGSAVGGDSDTLRAAIVAAGATIVYRWEMGISAVVTSGSDLQEWHEVYGGPTLTYPGAGQEPEYVENGFGVNSQPHMTFPASNDHLEAAITLAAGTRPGIYVVGQVRVSVAIDLLAEWSLAGATAGYVGNFNASTDIYRLRSASSLNTVTAGAGDVPALFAIRPLAAGWRAEKNGALAGTFGQTETISAIDKLSAGSHIGSNSARVSKLNGILITSASDDAVNTAVKNYYGALHSITMS